MKILYHHRTMGDGAEGIHIGEMVSALRAVGHEVLVVALTGDPTSPVPGRVSRVSVLHRLIPSFAYEVAELAYNVIGYGRVMEAVRAFRPAVIYDRYNSYSTVALKAARRTGLPLLLEVNAPVAYERSVYERLPLKFRRLAERYERNILNGADRIFAVSTPLKRHLVDAVGIDVRKIIVLPNGANPELFCPREGSEMRRRYAIADRTLIGFVGILRPWHGVDLLLTAFQKLRSHIPSVHLLIVGDGPIQHQLESQARDLGLDGAVTFTGRVRHADIVGHIAAMDICVSPHATFYASPMKLLEYMAMEKAVVAPAMENIRELIDDGENGLLFDRGSADALAAAMRRLVDDARLRRSLGARARQSVVDRFNWRHNARCVAHTAQSLVARSERRSR